MSPNGDSLRIAIKLTNLARQMKTKAEKRQIADIRQGKGDTNNRFQGQKIKENSMNNVCQ